MDGSLTPRGLGPLVMGIVNVTPDSFSDGGRFHEVESAVSHGLALLDEGADWLDIGGESTRPGAQAVGVESELRRVVPVIAAIKKKRPEAVISVDTSKALVAEAAIDAGATVVNDVTACGDPDMAALVAARAVDVCLMHMRGQPRTMQADTAYSDVVAEVEAFLMAAVARVVASGVPCDRILLDPGLGFGKAWEDNPRLIRAVPRFSTLGHRVLIGASRKRFIGHMTAEDEPQKRVLGSVGAALAAAAGGAAVVRVHDVRATIQALKVFWASMP